MLMKAPDAVRVDRQVRYQLQDVERYLVVCVTAHGPKRVCRHGMDCQGIVNIAEPAAVVIFGRLLLQLCNLAEPLCTCVNGRAWA